MARDLRNRIRKCGRCRKFEAAPPIAPMQPLTCSGPGELLHVDFTSIEETVPLKEEPVIRNVLVLQDHFSKYVVAYVVKDQTAHTAAVTLRNGYFGLFGAPAYLVSDQGKAFTGHLITHLCELYGVHKLRTSPYHAQTNGQVEHMNQTIIRMIGKLAEDKKARWSEHLPELLSAYNGTRSAVTGYSPYYLLFGRKNRMPVDCLFPTLCESPHRTKMEVSVATMQKQLMNLDAAGQCWVAQLASYNFSLEYQKGKDNTVADFLSRLDEPLPKEEVQDYLDKIPYPGVKAVLDNAITPLEERAELGVRPNPEGVNANQEEAVATRAAKLASNNIIDWKVEQKEDPVLYQVVKHLRAPRETFKEALLTVLDKKATTAYVKAKEQLLLKNGLLYRKTHIGPAKETIFQFVVPQRHRSAAMDGCHREAAHQGQRRSASLMQE